MPPKQIFFGSLVAGGVGLVWLVGYLILGTYLSNDERLISNFRAGLVERDFQSMYHASSDYMKLNVTEAEFVERMNVVTDILQDCDSELMFRRNVESENQIRSIRENSEPEASDRSAGYSFAFLELGPTEKSLIVHVSWHKVGIEPKLFDVSVGEPGNITNLINTVAGEPFRVRK